MSRGVRIHGSDDPFQLTHDSVGAIFGPADDVQGAGAFAVKSEVLGETLRDHQLQAFFQEDVQSHDVLVQVSGGVALVRRVKEREKLLFLADFGDFSPLFGGWVNTRRVVGTHVQ